MNFDSLGVVLAIAFALGFDTFAVGLAAGTNNPGKRASFRLYFHFGLFQFLMPIIGWYIGRTILPYISTYDHWIAFGLLAFIALRMIVESVKDLRSSNESIELSDISRGWSLVTLSLATSFDALGVGFSMGLTNSRLFIPAFIIGLAASVMTYAGIRLGRIISVKMGRRASILGGLILLVIAIKLLEI